VLSQDMSFNVLEIVLPPPFQNRGPDAALPAGTLPTSLTHRLPSGPSTFQICSTHEPDGLSNIQGVSKRALHL
jgi:hypothetical protein